MHISARHSRTAAWITLPLAVVASAAVIATASYAAFSDTTDNAGNAWRTGGVSLTDDLQGEALFDAGDLVPGSTGMNCITVTATTTNPTTVQLYTADQSDDDALAQYVGMTIERGSLATAGDCATFTAESTVHDGSLGDLLTKTSFGTGVGDWAPSVGESATTYRFSYDLADDAPNTTQNSEAGTTFVWEAQTA